MSSAAGGAVLSAEAADALNIAIGGTVTVALPDASRVDLPVSGIADLSRARVTVLQPSRW